MTNPDLESQRLRAFYAGLADGELEKLAAEAEDLTEVAKQALEAEITRRRLQLTSEMPTPTAPPTNLGEPDQAGLVIVGRFRDLPEALLAKGSLESAGIKCVLGDDNMIRMDWFISNLLGGIKLQVAEEDAAAALEILSQPIPDVLEVEGVGSCTQPSCPKCGSLDIGFEELNRTVAYTSAWIGLPLPLRSESWKCYACGARWIYEGDATSDHEQS
jgi:hypothetical protein